MTTPNEPNADYEREFYCPNIDVCAWCGDSECDGVGCIASLDPDSIIDGDAINELHELIRAGRVFLHANRLLAEAENR